MREYVHLSRSCEDFFQTKLIPMEFDWHMPIILESHFSILVPVFRQNLFIKQIDICMILYNLQTSNVFIVNSFFVWIRTICDVISD